MARGRAGAATVCGLAANEKDAEERAQGRGGGRNNSNADLNGRPDRNIHGGVKEVVNIGHAADEWDADNCSS